MLDGTEECDDGNTIATDRCTDQCELAVCGDGIVRTTVEMCDDANNDLTDGCTNRRLTASETSSVVCTGDDRCFGLYCDARSWPSIDLTRQDHGGRRAWFDSISEGDTVATGLALTEPSWLALRWVGSVNRWDWGSPVFGAAFFDWATGFPTLEEPGQAVLLRPDGDWENADSATAHPYVCLFEPRWVVDASTGHAFTHGLANNSFSAARLECINQGAELATITSESEQLIGASLSSNSNGIGMNQTDGELGWLTGEPIGYTNWGANEPRDLDCAILQISGFWETRSCGVSIEPICEID